MDTINQLTNMMISLIGVLSSVRIISHLLAMKMNLEEKETYKKKIKNCIIAVIVASSVFTIKTIVIHYFG